MPSKTVRVRKGDSIPSLAHQNGHFWETVWNDGANAELRQKRPSPNQLAPGDEVTIPELQKKTESGATEQRHRFKRKGVPSKLRLQLKTLGEPRKNEKYVLELDGELIEGTTDGEGKIEHPIRPDSKGGRLLLSEGAEEIPVKVGHLDPVEVLSGVIQRLNNLGYEAGHAAQKMVPKLAKALSEFQEAHKLDVTGEPDDKTKAKLLELHP
jgi:N-acetylmuramoyl-L-alanine amidase